MRRLLPVFVSMVFWGCASDNGGSASGGSGPSGSGGSGNGSGGGSSSAGTSTGTGHAESCASEMDHHGEGTYYDFANGDGNCTFGPSPDDLMVGAMNAPDYLNSAACGSCAEVTGPNATIRVRIVDQCPECPAGNIDFSPMAFDMMAAHELGRVPITWRYVPCDVTGPIQYHFKEGSSQWWTAVQIRNHKNAIQSVEYMKDGSFVSVNRESYNYFVEGSGMGQSSVTLRVTDVYGGVVTDDNITIGDNTTVDGKSQLPDCQ